MKRIEVSDDAFDIIISRAKTHANGDVLAYIDRLVGVVERHSYEELPPDIEIQLLKRYHPEQLTNAQAACAILAIIKERAPRRFENLVGFRFPDRSRIVLSRQAEEIGNSGVVRRIGESDCFLFVDWDWKSFREMIHQMCITIGFSITEARALSGYVKKGNDRDVSFEKSLKYC